MRTGNPPDELEVLLIFRVLRAGYRIVSLRLDLLIEPHHVKLAFGFTYNIAPSGLRAMLYWDLR